MIKLREFVGKNLVSYLREGDFAHAGEEEAIRLVMQGSLKYSGQKILDVGCGLGGTADFIQSEGWGIVTGIDIEEKSILYAKEHYPDVLFHNIDVLDVDRFFLHKNFDLICCFNSFYAFSDQEKALSALHSISHNKTQLIIFDYSIKSKFGKNKFYREDSRLQGPFKPVITDNIEERLNSCGWGLKNIVDISTNYIRWYKDLVTKLKENKQQIISKFSQSAYLKAHSTYSNLYAGLLNQDLGGTIVYSEKMR